MRPCNEPYALSQLCLARWDNEDQWATQLGHEQSLHLGLYARLRECTHLPSIFGSLSHNLLLFDAVVPAADCEADFGP